MFSFFTSSAVRQRSRANNSEYGEGPVEHVRSFALRDCGVKIYHFYAYKIHTFPNYSHFVDGYVDMRSSPASQPQI